ncbi:T9SS type A sorting domain-containing protein [Nonlabens antarcticus]|uniref:T9SS type A sorting domain-containing protein n=1 Tax=Nonlabens antarcticus TaxID=392714 RepID=UPI001890CEAC|nr:T9SS type A sorting domain-containing protein [Nonlabens antarcticus]
MRSLLLSFFLIAFCLSAQAQFWNEYSTGFPTPSTGISRFDIVDENVVWGIGYNGINPSNNIQQFSKSSDGGLTWTNGNFTLGDVGLGIGDITAIDDQIAFIAVHARSESQTGGVWKTEDGGSIWTKVTQTEFTAAASFPNVIQFYDNGDGVVIGDPVNGKWEIYRSADFGSTFTELNPANIRAPLDNETGYLAKKHVVDNSIWFTTSKGRIFHSIDRGVNWNVYPSPISDFGGADTFGDLSFSDTNKGVLQTNAGVVYSTVNAGVTWNQITTSGSGSPYGDNIAYIPGTSSIVSVGSDPAAAGSSYSLDDGVSWTNIDSEQHVDVAFFNLTTGFSGGFTVTSDDSGVFKYSSNILTENDIAFAKAISFYPNPTKNLINISGYDSIMNLELINLSGQTVKVLEPMEKVSLEGVQSGMYLLKITTNQGTETLPIIKE